MRLIVKNNDVYKWANKFLQAAGWTWPTNGIVQPRITVWERLRGITKVLDI